MNIQIEYSVDLLTVRSVTIKQQKYIEENGVRENVGMVHAKAYTNSATGRAELIAEVPEPYLSGVLAVWGDEPTVAEPVVEEFKEERIVEQ